VILAADIGGTKVELALIDPARDPREHIDRQRFATADAPRFEDLAARFIADRAPDVDLAVIAVAGPVVDQRAEMINAPWTVDAARVAESLALRRCILLNDLQATARGCIDLRDDEVDTLAEGDPEPAAVVGVIAPGTGLGSSFVTFSGARPNVHATEAGHADFAPTTPEQIELLSWLLKRHDHVSVERVCSGVGAPNIYNWLAETSRVDAAPDTPDAIRSADDPTPVIFQRALRDDACPRCAATLRIFTEILAAEAGNLLLRTMATGGLYLAGGIPPRIIDRLRDPTFLEIMRRKGRHRGLIERAPVRVCLEPRVALHGAARIGLDLLDTP
jgi:glucokinase